MGRHFDRFCFIVTFSLFGEALGELLAQGLPFVAIIILVFALILTMFGKLLDWAIASPKPHP